MTDDHNRNFRGGRPAAGGAANNDPLAELARLIGQTDQFSEFRKVSAPQAPAQPAPPTQHYGADPYAARGERIDPPSFLQQPAAPHPYGAPQLSSGQDLYRAGFEPPPEDHQPAQYDAAAYHQDAASAPHYDDYDDPPPARRRISIIAIAGVFALAVLGTAGAFGYRALFGSSGSSPPPVIKADTAPTKIVPASDAQSNKITDRVGAGQGEKLVSREEQPIDLKDKPFQATFPNVPGQASAPLPAPGASAGGAGETKKIRTIAIRPDQNSGAPVEVAPPQAPAPAARATAPAARQAAAAPRAEPEDTRPAGPTPVRQIPIRQSAAPASAPLSLNPDAQASAPAAAPAAPAARAAPQPRAVASAPTAAADPSGNYLVQVSSQRSEGEAQTAFRSLQGKYPAQLGNRQAVIRRADLGDKGTFYRAMVGPFASSEQANEVCSSLKAAGGSCIVQRN